MTVCIILPKQVKNELNNKFCKYYGTLSIQINVALIAIVAKSTSTSTSTNGLQPHSSILLTIEYTVCEHFNILGSILQCICFSQEADQKEYLEKHNKHTKCNTLKSRIILTYLHQQYSMLVILYSHFQAG